MTYEEITQHISQQHLRCCGGFHPKTSDDLPDDIKTVILIGNANIPETTGFWPAFENAGKALMHDESDPLENWTRQILTIMAAALNADVVFPFDGPPYIPVLTWARRAEPVFPSPFGPLIHPVYGLWHAYRGVLLFKEKIALPTLEPKPSPCDTCPDQPCLSTCPAAAITAEDFKVEACTNFLASAKGSTCLKTGCLARRACPIGQDHIYEPAQAAFHLQAFLKTHGPQYYKTAK